MTRKEIKPYQGDREVEKTLLYEDGQPTYGIYFMGGFPHIASRKLETRHYDGNGWDLAYFAMVRPDGLIWGQDADLMTDNEIDELLERFGTTEKCVNYLKENGIRWD